MLDPDLTYLLALSNFRSMVDAAERLSVSPSTLSRAIRRLELRFGVALVVRSSGGVRLTDAGHRLVSKARVAGIHLRDAEQEMHDIAKGRQGVVRIVAGQMISSVVVRALVPRLRAERPAANLVLDALFSDEILSGLINGEYDFGVCAIPMPLPPELEAHPILRDRLVPVVRLNHPITMLTAPPTVRDLFRFPWINGSVRMLSRPFLDALIANSGESPPAYAVECRSFEVMIDAVKNSDCVCFASDWLVQSGLGAGAGLAIVEILALAHPRNVGIVERKGAYLSPLAQRARELVADALLASAQVRRPAPGRSSPTDRA